MQKLDLSGLWRVYLDAEKKPELPAEYPDVTVSDMLVDNAAM